VVLSVGHGLTGAPPTHLMTQHLHASQPPLNKPILIIYYPVSQ
jgi:hypothetical protein